MSRFASSRSGQAWYADFAVALLLFTFTLIVYFSYTTNIQKEEKGSLDDMLTDAKSISSSLILSGYPTDWNNETVLRIGIAGEQEVNATKIKNFRGIDYNRSKKIFATVYDYFVFFTNSKGEVLNINGVCGIGHPLVETAYNIRSAYYYSSESDKLLKSLMNETFNADIYFGDNPSDLNDIDSLISNLSKYTVLMMEYPNFTSSVYVNYKDEIENFSSTGNLFMISGELVSGQDKEMVGVTFRKKTGQSSNQRTAIVNNTDPYLSLSIGQSMVFGQYYYVKNDTFASPPSSNLVGISTFNQTDDNAIARWQYGNGTVYFFSDFAVSFFSGDFVKMVGEAAQTLISGICTEVNITEADPKRLVKTERYLSHNSKVVKMVVYVWQ